MLILDRQTRPAGKCRQISGLARSDAEIRATRRPGRKGFSEETDESPGNTNKGIDRHAKQFLQTSERYFEMPRCKACKGVR